MSFYDRFPLLHYLARWFLLSVGIAAMAGSASAFFLHALEWATQTRLTHPWLLWLLPLAGFGIGWLYLRFGQKVEAGNNLLIDEIHDPKKVIPLRMAPLILGSTVLSHLFGASVGREGTAVQMGGALADQLTRVFRFSNEDRRIILMAGISAGFASVFGTPLAGAVFGLEVLSIGKLRYDAILPCSLSAVLADRVALFWNVQHTHYAIPHIPELALQTFLIAIVSGIAFGATGKAFAESVHRLSAWVKRRIHYAPLRPLAGGILIAVSAWILDANHYLGLGIPTIVQSFQQPLPAYDFIGKFAYTVVSLASGMKGGEVTPLFYIGATLGNALASLTHQPHAWLAGLGFVAVFAGSANTPIASTFMAMELFGSHIGIYALIACVTSYLFSGHSSIYKSQRVGTAKHKKIPEGITMGEVPQFRGKKSRFH